MRVARAQSITYYADVARIEGLDMASPADRNTLSGILGTISTYENQEGRPMLSAVVVLRDSGMPGHGFFELARELRLLDGSTAEEELVFFARELTRVHDHWSQHTR